MGTNDACTTPLKTVSSGVRVLHHTTLLSPREQMTEADVSLTQPIQTDQQHVTSHMTQHTGSRLPVQFVRQRYRL